jgi:hypothetical protein
VTMKFKLVRLLRVVMGMFCHPQQHAFVTLILSGYGPLILPSPVTTGYRVASWMDHSFHEPS